MMCKNATFHWGEAEDREFKIVKEAFQAPTLLAPYDPTKEIEAVIDTYAVGLAVWYFLTKTDYYTVYTSIPTIIHSDCAALTGFEDKMITDLTNKRMRDIHFKIQAYNYRIVFIKGSRNKIADCLSRLPTWLENKDGEGETLTIARCLVTDGSTDKSILRAVKHIEGTSPAASEDEAHMRVKEAIVTWKP